MERRTGEVYANDQESPDTLIAFSTASNRAKSNKDHGRPPGTVRPL
ncbi:hypothetical protein F750_6247 [Streptomyces sp. PAMC 26508]|nr:hypothetical protein F750_6247 [Streptomyces sp. PAMC 26508]